jgi:hypothetical protein
VVAVAAAAKASHSPIRVGCLPVHVAVMAPNLMGAVCWHGAVMMIGTSHLFCPTLTRAPRCALQSGGSGTLM